MNDNIHNQTQRFYAMYPKITFDNIAMFARDPDAREDGTKIRNGTDRNPTKNANPKEPRTNKRPNIRAI